MSRQSKDRLNQDPGEINEGQWEILERYNFRGVKEIKCKGYINSEKDPNNIRIMSVNVNRIRPE